MPACDGHRDHSLGVGGDRGPARAVGRAAGPRTAPAPCERPASPVQKAPLFAGGEGVGVDQGSSTRAMSGNQGSQSLSFLEPAMKAVTPEAINAAAKGLSTS